MIEQIDFILCCYMLNMFCSVLAYTSAVVIDFREQLPFYDYDILVSFDKENKHSKVKRATYEKKKIAIISFPFGCLLTSLYFAFRQDVVFQNYLAIVISMIAGALCLCYECWISNTVLKQTKKQMELPQVTETMKQRHIRKCINKLSKHYDKNVYFEVVEENKRSFFWETESTFIKITYQGGNVKKTKCIVKSEKFRYSRLPTVELIICE